MPGKILEILDFKLYRWPARGVSKEQEYQPLSLLCTATPDDVKAYCKNLIDVAAQDGGFILSTGAGMQGSKAENVKAMIDFSKQYLVYG